MRITTLLFPQGSLVQGNCKRPFCCSWDVWELFMGVEFLVHENSWRFHWLLGYLALQWFQLLWWVDLLIIVIASRRKSILRMHGTFRIVWRVTSFSFKQIVFDWLVLGVHKNSSRSARETSTIQPVRAFKFQKTCSALKISERMRKQRDLLELWMSHCTTR